MIGDKKGEKSKMKPAQSICDVEPIAKLLHHEGNGTAQLNGKRRGAEHHLFQKAIAQNANVAIRGILLCV